MSPAAWWRSAACGPGDLALFFGDDDETPRERAVRESAALAICSACPVRVPCLTEALGFPSQHGIVAGLTEDERKSLRHALLKRQQRQERAA